MKLSEIVRKRKRRRLSFKNMQAELKARKENLLFAIELGDTSKQVKVELRCLDYHLM